MTKAQFEKLVQEAAWLKADLDALDQQRKATAEQLEEKKKAIAAAIATKPDLAPSAPTDGGGTSWTSSAKVGDRTIGVRVTQPAPKLRSDVTEAFDKLKAIAGRAFNKLFAVKYSVANSKSFRQEAYRLLGRENGNKLIKLCEVPSVATVNIG